MVFYTDPGSEHSRGLSQKAVKDQYYCSDELGSFVNYFIAPISVIGLWKALRLYFLLQSLLWMRKFFPGGLFE